MLFKYAMFTFLSFTLFTFGQVKNRVDSIVQTLQEGDFKQRRMAINQFEKLTIKEKSKLKDILQKSDDPELRDIYKNHFKHEFIFEGKLVYARRNDQSNYHIQLVMSLEKKGDKVSGSYYYPRFQKILKLEGKYDKKSRQLTMTERYDGQVTGHFEGKITADTFSGQWFKTKARRTVYNFNFNKVDTFQDKRKFSSYSKKIKGIPKVQEAYLRVSEISDKTFSFFYGVTARNYNAGRIQGVAKIVKPGYAIYKNAEGAVLEFYLKNGVIKTVANDVCKGYCNFRTNFSWELTKN